MLLQLVLLFLHRSFFARAITTNPENPLESPYMHSFVTAYQCAVVMLRTTKTQFALHPQLMSRVWQIWTFNFISSVSNQFSFSVRYGRWIGLMKTSLLGYRRGSGLLSDEAQSWPSPILHVQREYRFIQRCRCYKQSCGESPCKNQHISSYRLY